MSDRRRKQSGVKLFTISEAARLVGVSEATLRLWEREGLIRPIRSQGRYRRYTERDIALLKEIKYLRQVKKLNAAGIRYVLELKGTAPRASSLTSGNTPLDSIGPKLRALREKHGLTLREVSERTSLSISFISAVERSQATPSVAALQKLAAAYQTTLLHFFEALSGGEKKLVRPSERKVLQPDQEGVKMELLVEGTRMMEPHLFTVAPGAGSGGAYAHEGEEFLFILQGTIEIWLDEVERYTLQPGDSFYFSSSTPHRWQNIGDEQAVILWINTPATF